MYVYVNTYLKKMKQLPFVLLATLRHLSHYKDVVLNVSRILAKVSLHHECRWCLPFHHPRPDMHTHTHTHRCSITVPLQVVGGEPQGPLFYVIFRDKKKGPGFGRCSTSHKSMVFGPDLGPSFSDTQIPIQKHKSIPK